MSNAKESSPKLTKIEKKLSLDYGIIGKLEVKFGQIVIENKRYIIKKLSYVKLIELYYNL